MVSGRTMGAVSCRLEISFEGVSSCEQPLGLTTVDSAGNLCVKVTGRRPLTMVGGIQSFHWAVLSLPGVGKHGS